MVRTKLCAQTIAEEKRWWSWYWNLGEVALVFYIAVASLWTPWDDKNPKDRSTPVSNKENRNSNNPSLEHRCIHGANQRFRSVLNLLTDLPVSFKQQGSTVHSPWQELGGQVSDDSICDADFCMHFRTQDSCTDTSCSEIDCWNCWSYNGHAVRTVVFRYIARLLYAFVSLVFFLALISFRITKMIHYYQ